jgi:hypothetical protein
VGGLAALKPLKPPRQLRAVYAEAAGFRSQPSNKLLAAASRKSKAQQRSQSMSASLCSELHEKHRRGVTAVFAPLDIKRFSSPLMLFLRQFALAGLIP